MQEQIAALERIAATSQSIGSGVASAAGASLSAFRTGGTFAAGQLGLAGEAGPELVKFRGGGEGLFTSPTLFKFPEPGRIYSAPTTSRKLSNKAGKDGTSQELAQVKKMLKQVLENPGNLTTNVMLEGMSPDEVRRQITRMQVETLRGNRLS